MKAIFVLSTAFLLASSPTNAERLKKFLSPSEWQAQQNYSQAFQQVKTQADFIKVFRQAQNLPATATFQKHWDLYMSDQVKQARPDFEWVQPLFPGLELQFEGEGTIAVLETYFPDFAKLAKKTTAKDDDQFIALMQSLHGDVNNGYRNWMEQTWDYGGCSYLGSGKHSQLLKAIQTQLKNKSPFQIELKDEEARLKQDLTQSVELCGPRQAASKEMQQLLKSFSWNKAEQQALQKRSQEIQSGKIPDNVLNSQ